jgi:hypothetical protein
MRVLESALDGWDQFTYTERPRYMGLSLRGFVPRFSECRTSCLKIKVFPGDI